MKLLHLLFAIALLLLGGCQEIRFYSGRGFSFNLGSDAFWQDSDVAVVEVTGTYSDAIGRNTLSYVVVDSFAGHFATPGVTCLDSIHWTEPDGLVLAPQAVSRGDRLLVMQERKYPVLWVMKLGLFMSAEKYKLLNDLKEGRDIRSARDFSHFSVRYAAASPGHAVPGYVDSEQKIFYQWRCVEIESKIVPYYEGTTAVILLFNPEGKGYRTEAIDPPIVYLRRSDEMVDSGYFDSWSAIFFKWKDASIRVKEIPKDAKVLDSKTMKLEVVEIAKPVRNDK